MIPMKFTYIHFLRTLRTDKTLLWLNADNLLRAGEKAFRVVSLTVGWSVFDENSVNVCAATTADTTGQPVFHKYGSYCPFKQGHPL